MDRAMMQQLLQTYGAQDTPENVQLAQQFFASNPQVAEHRAMGMRGSVLDDNSDLLTPLLNKLMQQTAMPQQASTPRSVPPAVAAPAAVRSTVQRQQQASSPSQAAPGRQDNYGGFPDRVNPLDAPNAPSATPDDNGLWDWLRLLLMPAAGATAAASRGSLPATTTPPEATYVGRMNPRSGSVPNSLQGRGQQQTLPAPNAQLPAARSTSAIEGPQGRITDRTARGTDSSIGQEIDQINNRNATMKNARETQLRNEVDDENAQARRLQEQIAQRQRAQGSARETAKAAKRTFGGR